MKKLQITNYKLQITFFLWGSFILFLYVRFLLERKGICLKLPF